MSDPVWRFTAETQRVVGTSTGGSVTSFTVGARAGAPGRSAYQIEVDAGFVGTEDEWRASLGSRIKVRYPGDDMPALVAGDVLLTVQAT